MLRALVGGCFSFANGHATAGDLLAEQDGPKRIAVLDNVLNERLYVFAEIDARARGCALRRFDTQAEAMRWLDGQTAEAQR